MLLSLLETSNGSLRRRLPLNFDDIIQKMTNLKTCGTTPKNKHVPSVNLRQNHKNSDKLVKNALRSRIEIGRVAEGVDHHRDVFRGVAIDDGRDDCILLHEEVPLLAKPRLRFAKF